MCVCRGRSANSTCGLRWRSAQSWQSLQTWLFLACSVGLFWSAGVGARPFSFCTADVGITFTDPESHLERSESAGLGVFGVGSELRPESGVVVHVLNEDGGNHGCSPPINVPQGEPWIALVRRGGCKFQDKILYSAVHKNASAVVIYNNVPEEDLVTMSHDDFGGGFISIFMGLKGGARVATLVDSGIPVHMNISIRELTVYNVVSNSSMAAASSMLPSDPTFIFVSLGLLVMVVLGLVCLLVYGIRRARCSNHKSRARIVFTLPASPRDTSQVQEGLLNSAESQDSTESTAIYLPNGRA